MDHGATLVQDDLGGTPLHDAAEHGQMDVRLLSIYLSMYLSINPSISLALTLFLSHIHSHSYSLSLSLSQAIKVLIFLGGDATARDHDGMTPADLAREGGYVECATYLKQQQSHRRSSKSDVRHH